MGGGASVHKIPAEVLLKDITADQRIGGCTAEEAIETLGASFNGTADSPKDAHFLDWILGPKFAAAEQSAERKTMCDYNAKFGVLGCTKKGTILGLRDSDTKEVLGVMLLRRTPETDGEMMSTMMKAGKPPHMKAATYGKGPLKRDEAIVKTMKKLKISGTQYIVYMLGVKPQHQGKGVAKALMHALFEISDRDQAPVYLDSMGDRLEALFAHLGFELQQKIEVADPIAELPPEKMSDLDLQGASGPRGMVSMVRKPKPK